MSSIETGKAITERLRNEAKSATRSWALVESFNGKDESHRRLLHRGLERAGLGVTVNDILKALVRDTLSSLFRVTDDAGNKGERQTFCALIPLLNDQQVIALLEDEASTPEFLKEENIALVRRSVAHLLRCVPVRWTDGTPENSTLYDLRKELRPVRDSLLSHSLDYKNIRQATFGETRSFLRITNELEHAASSAFHCLSESIDERWLNALRHADRFWDIAEAGAKPFLKSADTTPSGK